MTSEVVYTPVHTYMNIHTETCTHNIHSATKIIRYSLWES